MKIRMLSTICRAKKSEGLYILGLEEMDIIKVKNELLRMVAEDEQFVLIHLCSYCSTEFVSCMV